MAAKQMILRELEKLPADKLKESQRFVSQLKKSSRKKQAPARDGKALARMRIVAIKKWAGQKLAKGFTGKDHDRILYGGRVRVSRGRLR